MRFTMYECWNPRCCNYATAGVRLKESETRVDATAQRRCATCDAPVRVVMEGDGCVRPMTCAVGGALLGWVAGGVPGAAIGALLGLILGSAA